MVICTNNNFFINKYLLENIKHETKNWRTFLFIYLRNEGRYKIEYYCSYIFFYKTKMGNEIGFFNSKALFKIKNTKFYSTFKECTLMYNFFCLKSYIWQCTHRCITSRFAWLSFFEVRRDSQWNIPKLCLHDLFLEVNLYTRIVKVFLVEEIC